MVSLKLSRRDALKLGLATATGLALGSSVVLKPRFLTKSDSTVKLGDGEIKKVNVICVPNCTENCGLVAHVHNGRISALLPAKYFPEPEYNRGCLRGLSTIFLFYGPDRLRKPLIRRDITKRGTPEGFEEVDWDTALDYVAERLADIVIKYGPASVAYTVQVPGTGYINKGALMRLASLFGFSSMHAYPLNGDLPTFWAPTFGVQTEELETHEYLNSKLILVFGSDFLQTRTMSARMFVLAKERGAKIIVVDPNYCRTAKIADEWIPINPATDAALALGIVHVLIRDRLYDEEFVKTYTDMPLLVRLDAREKLKAVDVKVLAEEAKKLKTQIPAYRELYVAMDKSGKLVIVDPRTLERIDPVTGERWDPILEGEFEVELVDGSKVKVKPVFQLLKELVMRDYTPEKVAKIIAPKPELEREYVGIIEKLARDIATIKPMAVIYGASNYQWYNGDLKGRALSLLVALTGNIGKPGAGISTYAGVFKIRLPVWGWWGYDLEYKGKRITRRPRWLNWSVFLNDEYRESEEWKKYRSPEVPWPEKGVKALFIQWWNPFDQHNKANKLAEKAKKGELELIVTTEIQWTTSVEYSDVVLPAASWHEKYELVATPLHPYLQLGQPAHEPLFESMPEIWIFKEIAVRLARKLAERLTDEELVKLIGLNREELLHLASNFYLDPELQRREDEARARREWSLKLARELANQAAILAIKKILEDGRDVVFSEGVRVSLTEGITFEKLLEGPQRLRLPTPGHRQIPFWLQVNKKIPFPQVTLPFPLAATARFVKSGRIEFYKDEKAFRDLGEELPVHKDPFEESVYKWFPQFKGKYELVYLTKNSIYRVHSTHSNNAMLLVLQDRKPRVWINPETAARKGIKEGDLVEVYNDFGRVRGYAALDPGVHPKVVIFEQGWWRRYTFDTHYNSPNYPWIKPTEIIYFTPGVWEPNTKWNNTLVDIRKVT